MDFLLSVISSGERLCTWGTDRFIFTPSCGVWVMTHSGRGAGCTPACAWWAGGSGRWDLCHSTASLSSGVQSHTRHCRHSTPPTPQAPEPQHLQHQLKHTHTVSTQWLFSVLHTYYFSQRIQNPMKQRVYNIICFACVLCEAENVWCKRKR